MALVIFVSVSLMIENLRELREKFKHKIRSQDLTFALYEEALGPDGVDSGEISIDQLKDALSKHEGLFWVMEFRVSIAVKLLT